MGILLADERTAPIVRKIIDASNHAMENGGGSDLMPPEALAQMFDATTLRNMINFGGPQVEKLLPEVLAELKKAVQ